MPLLKLTRSNFEIKQINCKNRGRWGAKVVQPLYYPEMEELISNRIDVLHSFLLGSGEKGLQWCQVKVIKCWQKKAKPAVVVCWDLQGESMKLREWYSQRTLILSACASACGAESMILSAHAETHAEIIAEMLLK
jgi:hypothetical protein